MTRFSRVAILGICSLTMTFSLQAQNSAAEEDTVQDVRVVFKTAKGDLHAVIYASKTPITAANFLNLVKRNFYDGVGFHAKDPEYYVQGGDPTGTGRGLVGYWVETEIVEGLKHDGAGVLSMARKKQPDTNGSQFFMTLAPCPHLDGLYTIFGKITKGVELLPSLEIGDVIRDIEILDSTDLLFKNHKQRIREWNRILDSREKLPKTPPAPAPAKEESSASENE